MPLLRGGLVRAQLALICDTELLGRIWELIHRNSKRLCDLRPLATLSNHLRTLELVHNHIQLVKVDDTSGDSWTRIEWPT